MMLMMAGCNTGPEGSSGNNYLAVEEGHYSIYCAGQPIILGKEHSNWIWKQWGFYRM